MGAHSMSAAISDYRATRGIASYAPATARVLLGLIFAVVGLNGFLNFIPQPSTPMPDGAVAFSVALFKSGYMMPLVSGTQLAVGVLLLSNRFVPLALAVIAPVIVNIIAFHLFLAPAMIGMALLVLALELYLAWAYRAAYRPLLAARATPGSN
jgi:uncharacterized membrane protein YphA (DoxX/SURF4 family)